MHNTECTNQLIHETSPYLQQHARNPVDWYPWSKEAFEKARRENKPILLSIGYSACHWCHVMAHESFEDAETAKTMNALFVNIKVDREERPDLDKIYQNAYQLLNRRGGGWPLTMFLTPDDQVPFFGATYIPKEPRFGLPSFTDLMQRLIRFYRENENKVREQNDSMMAALIAQNKPRQARTGYTLNAEPLQEVCAQLAQQFDANQGGFSQAPKFPSPLPIERLLRHWSHTTSNGKPDRSAETMACFTLRKMALGGIYDHLGGGFFRYSVDDKWMIPHFEKMLYDNGPLLTLYSEAWQATGNPLFRRVCEETGAWVIREMQAPEGGYYSSFDADSEGEEGRFYVWTPDEVRKRLTPEEYAAFAPRYGLDREANFEDHWHLHVNDGPAGLASPRSFDSTDLDPLVKRARQKLLEERGKRVRPGRDEKVLTAWNGLMIKAMAGTGRRLDCAGLVESAERSLDFIRSHLWQGGRLLATYKDGQAKFNAYLDDYAFLIDGILELLQARWRDGDLEFAQTLADVLLEHFQDRKGGFYFTAENHEQLIQRPKPLYDDALPTGNGIAAQVLFKLGHLLSSMRYLVAGERTLKWAWPAIEQSPMPCNALLLALEEYFYPGQTIILRGQGKILESWRKRCSRAYAPRRLILAIPASVNNLPETLTKKTGVISGDVTAYLCAGTGCSPPITDLAELEATLAASEIIAG